MDIETLPILPSDYPLFDWSQFQSSYDALYAGGEVAAFKKEAWNAIVDHLAVTLGESGIEWDDKYTSIFGAKVNVAYGALYADQFNSVVHNADNAISLGWRWSFDRSFRGYVGRKTFKGDLKYGENADLFYPEYIKELVRRMNLLTEVLRGTAPLRDSGSKNRSYSDSIPYILQKPSFLITGQGKSFSETIGRLMKPKSSVALYAESSFSEVLPFARSVKSSVFFEQRENITTKNLLTARSLKSAPAYAMHLSQTKSAHTLYAKRTAFVVYDERSETMFDALGFAVPRSGVAELYETSETQNVLTAVDLPSARFAVSETAETAHTGEMNAPDAFPITAKETAHTGNFVRVYAAESVPVRSIANRSCSVNEAIVDQIKTINALSEEKIHSKNKVAIDSAWYPPELVEDGVYFVRQVYDYNFDENTGVLEVI